ncbi:MAG: choice-of-anchor J domain-containing protein [Bacteroidales bacterium]|nr:choice-of-anchor J domain-containing protein [Bacteroidales bacterium]
MKIKILFSTILIGFILSAYSQNSILYSDSFETISDFDNWTQVNVSGDADWNIMQGLPYGGFSNSQDGNTNAVFYSYNYNEDQTMLISPVMDLSSVDVALLSFYLLQPAWSLDLDNLTLYYRTSLNSQWFELEVFENSIMEWEKQVVVLPDACETYQIAFLAKSGYGYGIGLDNISISQGADCNEVKGFEFINIKESSIYCSWHENSAITYEIEYGALGFTFGEGTRISNININSTFINNLVSGVDYSLYIRSYCEEGVSSWEGPYNFYTECKIGQQIPYFESFENDLNPMECWTVLYGGETHNLANNVIVDDVLAFTGNSSLRFSSYEVGSPYDQFLISPEISGTEILELSFRYRTLSGSQEVFSVGMSSDNQNPMNSVVWSENITDADNSWKEYKALIPVGTSNILIHYKSVYEYYLYVDEIRISYPEQCNTAENLIVSDITENSAKLFWTGTSQDYKVEYGVSGFSKGNGIVVENVQSTESILTGLNPGTTYLAYVITECGGMDLYSQGLEFTTLDTEIIDCQVVTDFVLDSISISAAKIKWLNFADQTLWNVEFGKLGFAQGTGTIIEGLYQPGVFIDELEPNTEYGVYVQGFCSNSNQNSDWSEQFIFKTKEEVEVVIIDVPADKPNLILNAVDSIIYICDNNIGGIDIAYELYNAGNNTIFQGTNISYIVKLKTRSLSTTNSIIITQDLNPGDTFYFTEKLDYSIDENDDQIGISLSNQWSSGSDDNSDNIDIVFISNEIVFENELNGIIEVKLLPELITAKYESNYDSNILEYIWSNNETGNSIFASNEGIYTLTVKTDFCLITNSVIVEENKGVNNNTVDYEIYPNPSDGGMITILNNSSETNTKILIYDSIGRVVFNSVLASIEQQIDLSGLSSGVYNVAFVNGDNTSLKRLFIK